jgi:hypothetical protein
LVADLALQPEELFRGRSNRAKAQSEARLADGMVEVSTCALREHDCGMKESGSSLQNLTPNLQAA